MIAETVEMPTGWALAALRGQAMLPRLRAGDVLRALVPAKVMDFVTAVRALERTLERYVDRGYSRDAVETALDDDHLADCSERVTGPAFAVARRVRWLAKMRPRWIFSPDALANAEVLRRVELAAKVQNELTAALFRQIDRGPLADPQWLPASTAPAEERRSNRSWFVFDPAIPVEVSQRLLAGRKANLAMQMFSTARRKNAWTVADRRRAATDWADWTFDHAGLVASLLGVSFRSLPAASRFDHEAVMAQHRETRARFMAMAEDAERSLDE